jgi:hypothetical protein
MVHVIDDNTTMAAPGLQVERPACPDDLMTMVHAASAAVPAARKLLWRSLDTLAWLTETAEDIELAVNEAIANVVNHAYPPDAPDSPPCTPGSRPTHAPGSAGSSWRSPTTAAGRIPPRQLRAAGPRARPGRDEWLHAELHI